MRAQHEEKKVSRPGEVGPRKASERSKESRDKNSSCRFGRE